MFALGVVASGTKEALYGAVLDYCVSGYVERVEAEYVKTSAKDHVVRRIFQAMLGDFNANRAIACC